MFRLPYSWDLISLVIEGVPVLLLVPMFVLARRYRLDKRFSRLSRRVVSTESRALAVVAVISFGVAALASAVRPAAPFVHDEFSYLLAGDTFANGRLTNPVHPFWRHFETFHVLQQPSYQSKYPPAQGLFLAAGQLLAGRPIVGVWISLALASAALYWCLRAWTPRGWALFGALLPCMRFGSGFYWNEHWWAYWSGSFWGGAVALLGASLALGAVPRLLRRPRLRESLILGFGFATLAGSRPFEGLIVASLISLLLVRGLVQRAGWRALARGFGPATVVVGIALSALGYYHWRVAGSAFIAPYSAYAHSYDVVPFFTFQELAHTPEYHHEVLRRFHLGFMLDSFQAKKEGVGFAAADLRLLTGFFLGPLLALVTLVGLLWRSRWLAFILVLALAAFLSHAVTQASVFRPHYFAPFVPAILVLTVRGLRVIHAGRFRGLAVGVPVAKAVVFACVVTFAASVWLRAQLPLSYVNPLEYGRRRVAARLAAEGGKHVVFVRYGPRHNIHMEWVYNLSEIDEAPIIWARDMEVSDNLALIARYRDSQAWLLEPDARPPTLIHYPSGGLEDAPPDQP